MKDSDKQTINKKGLANCFAFITIVITSLGRNKYDICCILITKLNDP